MYNKRRPITQACIETFQLSRFLKERFKTWMTWMSILLPCKPSGFGLFKMFSGYITQHALYNDIRASWEKVNMHSTVNRTEDLSFRCTQPPFPPKDNMMDIWHVLWMCVSSNTNLPVWTNVHLQLSMEVNILAESLIISQYWFVTAAAWSLEDVS